MFIIWCNRNIIKMQVLEIWSQLSLYILDGQRVSLTYIKDHLKTQNYTPIRRWPIPHANGLSPWPSKLGCTWLRTSILVVIKWLSDYMVIVTAAPRKKKEASNVLLIHYLERNI